MGSLEERLFLACSRGDADGVKHYLKKGANMNMICSTGRTPFGTAAQLGNTAILKVFLENCIVGDKSNLESSHFNQRMYESSSSEASSPDKSNLGYFVFVHNEHGSMGSPGDDTQIKMDENLNSSYQELYYNFHDGGEICSLESFDECHIYMSAMSRTTLDLASFNDPFIRRDPRFKSTDWINEVDLLFDEEALTPDGMDNLEWDMEVEGNKDVTLEDDDPWGALYLWYAGILSQTSALLEEKPPPNDIDREDQFGRRALHYAAVEGHVEAVKLLINAGCKINVGDSDNLTPLHMAAARDAPEIIELLIKAGANVHHKTTDKITPLHVSASRGLLQNVELLISAGAHVDTLDSSDRTPLFMAVSRCHQDVVAFLLDHNAKVNIEEIHGYTPLYEAVWQKNTKIVKMLLDAGAKVTQSHHLLHYAVLHRHEAMVRLLISAGSIINLRDESGDTPLIVAAKTHQSQIARLLLSNGASVNCSSYVTGNTPLHEAVENIRGNFQLFADMFSVLEEFNVNLDAQSESGYTALHLAVVQKQDDAAAMLIRHGANVNHRHAIHLLHMFSCILLRGNRFLSELFIFAGYQFRDVQISSCTSSPIEQWILHLKCNPMRLSDLCRINIRTQFKSKVYQKVSALTLPSVIKTYLKLEDICND